MTNILENKNLIKNIDVLVSDLKEEHKRQWEKSQDSFDYVVGKKYIKIVTTNAHGKPASAWGFVDKDGHIYKAATWSRPAKHPRGNVNDGYEIKRNRIYGPDYLRRGR